MNTISALFWVGKFAPLGRRRLVLPDMHARENPALTQNATDNPVSDSKPATVKV